MDPGIHELMHVTGVASVGIEIHKHPGGNEQSRATIRLNDFFKIPPASDPGGNLRFKCVTQGRTLYLCPNFIAPTSIPLCVYVQCIYDISQHYSSHFKSSFSFVFPQSDRIIKLLFYVCFLLLFAISLGR